MKYASRVLILQLTLSLPSPPLSNIKAVGVSAATGEGVERLFEAFEESAVEFQEEYLPELLKYVI